jgi:hypothetical protein
MYKVKEKFKGAFVACDKFSVNLKEANQNQLEHLYHIGHIGVEFTNKKPKNKQVDNFETEATDNINE